MRSGDDTSVSTGPDGASAPLDMNADLGLFYQLLQMVDGDWSDSIQGICDHIRERFGALIVVLSVLDKTFNEFIYTAFTVSAETEQRLSRDGSRFTPESVLADIKRIYAENNAILDYGIYHGDILQSFASIYFRHDRERTVRMLTEMRMRTLFVIPLLETNRNYRCTFHVITDHDYESGEKEFISQYSAQLNVALEIVFLVRELYTKATHDCLTKLFNRKQGHLMLERDLERIPRNRQPLALAMMDIDHFKRINDTHGHPVGDEVLQATAALLSEGLRKCDVVARYGGEEFMLILPDTDLPHAAEVIRRLREKIERASVATAAGPVSLTASFGIAVTTHDRPLDASALIAEADRKLYLAKQNGRNRVEC
ncbi:MAG TPA: GGDEF domain-containing protein [Spirochaetota bacterium]|nr:GGDEF domain-containing protein [Spirochaetota bacterium]HNT09647.1 GGDEF domain-containing protein [Spirochaetota bacterium]HNV45656.1 GGDEF domain-containing protein [Spirochaetota bacterium]HOS39037.1 GGDEF domain-containing protein [Spirochaetota bacterium]HPU88038.1 GGDEF domain-containing protein [Spirochaetota bacterium]